LIFVLSAIFLGVLTYVADHSMENLPRMFQPTVYVSLPVVGGLAALSFCSLLGAFSETLRSSAASHVLKRVSEDPARNFFLGFLIAAYLGLVRPPLIARVPSLSYVEWVSIVLTVYAMFSLTKFSSKEYYVTSENLGWKKHIQEVKRETGRELSRVTSVMEQFIVQGVKEPLLVYLTFYLQRLGKTEEETFQTLSSLIHYQDTTRTGKLSFVLPWTRKKLAAKNKKIRENLLNALIEKIDRLCFDGVKRS